MPRQGMEAPVHLFRTPRLGPGFRGGERKRAVVLLAAGVAALGVAIVTAHAQAAGGFKPMGWTEFRARYAPWPKPDAKIAYGPGPQQFGELWLPEGDGPHPLVVRIHGGCWTKSVATLNIMNPAAADLRRRGLAVWNIEYRGVDEPGGGYPGTYQDVAAALDRVGGFADEAKLKLDRVVVAGHSAGGHLALWTAARRKIASGPLARRSGLPVEAVMAIGAIPNLETDTNTACGVDSVEKMVGPARLGGRYGDTSPAHMLPLRTRQIVVVGANDTTTPPAISAAYVSRAKAAGDRIEYRLLPDAAHAEEIAPGTPGWDRIAPLIEKLAK